METLTNEQLLERVRQTCREWQVRLRLMDWDVEVRIVRHWDMRTPTTIGEITWSKERRMGIIRLLCPQDLPAVATRFIDGEELDYDLTIVHELLHLHLAAWDTPDDSAEEVAMEQAINCISKTLINLQRLASPPIAPEIAEAGQYL